MNRAADGGDAPPANRPEPLSRFEGRCLYRRTCECDEALQLAVLGVERTQERHGDEDAERDRRIPARCRVRRAAGAATGATMARLKVSACRHPARCWHPGQAGRSLRGPSSVWRASVIEPRLLSLVWSPRSRGEEERVELGLSVRAGRRCRHADTLSDGGRSGPRQAVKLLEPSSVKAGLSLWASGRRQRCLVSGPALGREGASNFDPRCGADRGCRHADTQGLVRC